MGEGAATWVAANRRAGRQHVLPLLQSAGDPSTLEVAKAKVPRGLHQAEFASLFHVPPDGHSDERSVTYPLCLPSPLSSRSLLYLLFLVAGD